MAVEYRQSLTGFVVEEFRMDPESGNPPAVHGKIGQPRRARLQDGTIAWTEPDVMDVIVTGTVGVRLLGRLRAGDEVVLSGRASPVTTVDLATGHTGETVVFLADRVGHDVTALTYEKALDRHLGPRIGGHTVMRPAPTPPPSGAVVPGL